MIDPTALRVALQWGSCWYHLDAPNPAECTMCIIDEAARRYLDAEERGIVIVPETCETCGGWRVFTEEAPQGSGLDYIAVPCASCGGSAEEWPTRALDAMRQVTERIPPWEALDIFRQAMKEEG